MGQRMNPGVQEDPTQTCSDFTSNAPSFSGSSVLVNTKHVSLFTAQLVYSLSICSDDGNFDPLNI